MENTNDFFGENISRIREDARKMIEALMHFDSIERFEKEMDEKLGEPDEVETFNDGILIYERRIWHIDTGDIIKVNAIDTASMDGVPKPIQDQLKEALAIEDYETASVLRDLIAEQLASSKNL